MASTSSFNAPSETTFAPSSSSGDAAHPIFLSHSGLQKDFVEHLNEHLKRAGHSPFFDEQSIPIGIELEYIKEKARQATVGVLVLSDDFMKSKWPMMELEILMNSCEIVIPVFFKLSPNDLTSPKKLTEWREKWETMQGVDTSGWECAVTSLAHHAGVIYRAPAKEGVIHRAPATEIAFIDEVVRKICLVFPPRVLYDMPYAKGVPRLIQDVERQFSGTPIIGMHGVGGIGKTTLCRIMANFYFRTYRGKSAVLEFPSDKNEDKIVGECKKVLGLLTDASDDLLKRVHHFGQAVSLMKDRMTSHSFFLAVDNIWAHSSEEASQTLKAGFGPGSKVLYTSRSHAVLKEVLENCDECVGPVPSMNKEEATEAFKAGFGDDLSELTTVVNKAVNLCMFSGCYHPLALQKVGRQLKMMGDASELERNLSEVTLSIKGSEVEDLIRLNYDNLSPTLQHMFLDVGLVFRRTRTISGKYAADEMRLEEMRDVLSILYERGHGHINEQLQRLALAGLLTVDSAGVVEVHDLYGELALREAYASPRFLLSEPPNMKEVRWGELERVLLDFDIASAVELHDCPKVQLLYAYYQAFSKGLRLKGMNALRVLKVDHCTGNLTGLKAVPMLAMLHLAYHNVSNIEAFSAQTHEDLRSCRKLKSLVLNGCTGCDSTCVSIIRAMRLCVGLYVKRYIKMMLDLSASLDLENLVIQDWDCLEEIRGLSLKLLSISLQGCENLQRIPDLRGLVRLEQLSIVDTALEDIEGLPLNLISILLDGCENLHRIPNLSGLVRLEQLSIGNTALEDIEGLPFNLISISLYDCRNLHRIPDLSGLVRLETLSIKRTAVEEIECLPFNLLSISLDNCHNLRRIPDLSGMVRLESLSILSCFNLQRIPNLSGLVRLERLSLTGTSVEEMESLPFNLLPVSLKYCKNVQRLLDLSGMVRLESLAIEGVDMEEMVSLPSTLKEIELKYCKNLRRIPNLKGMVRLRSLFISYSVLEEIELPYSIEVIVLFRMDGLRSLSISRTAVEESEGSPSNLKSFFLTSDTLQRIPDLSGMMLLRSLNISCPALEEIEAFPSNLQEIALGDVYFRPYSVNFIPRVCSTHRLRRIPNLGGMVQLQTLYIIDTSLKEIEDFSSTTLRRITLYGEMLERIPDLSGMVGLETLTIGRTALEEIKGLPSSLETIFLQDCPRLKRIPDLSRMTLKLIRVKSCRYLQSVP